MIYDPVLMPQDGLDAPPALLGTLSPPPSRPAPVRCRLRLFRSPQKSDFCNPKTISDRATLPNDNNIFVYKQFFRTKNGGRTAGYKKFPKTHTK